MASSASSVTHTVFNYKNLLQLKKGNTNTNQKKKCVVAKEADAFELATKAEKLVK